MCSYVGASCALPLAHEASGQAVARCVATPRCSRGFNHEWLQCWQMSHAFLCCLPSGLWDSCLFLHSSCRLFGKLVYVRHIPSMPAKFCLSSDTGILNLSMGDSLRHKENHWVCPEGRHLQACWLAGCNLPRVHHWCKGRHLRNWRHQISHADITRVLWASGF